VYDNLQQHAALNYLPRKGSYECWRYNRSLQLQAALDGPEAILLVDHDAKINTSHCDRGHSDYYLHTISDSKAHVPAPDRTLDELLADIVCVFF
jgi:hypothetical protein